MIHEHVERLLKRRPHETRGHERSEVAPRRILIVEDESSMRDFIDRVLRDAGYWTARMVDGQEALALAEQLGPFDLLLTDLVMPRMSGTELARQLRQTNPTLKILYFTGYSDRLVKEKGAGWDDDEAFLEKPSTVDEIVEAVSRLLDGFVPPEGRPLTWHL